MQKVQEQHHFHESRLKKKCKHYAIFFKEIEHNIEILCISKYKLSLESTYKPKYTA